MYVCIDFCYLVAVLVVEVVLFIETSSRKIEIAGLVRYNYTNKWVLI